MQLLYQCQYESKVRKLLQTPTLVIRQRSNMYIVERSHKIHSELS
jgi:hypothetical protein